VGRAQLNKGGRKMDSYPPEMRKSQITAVLQIIRQYDLNHGTAFAFMDKLLLNHPDLYPELLKGGVYE
jgi:hypothetical protein